VKFIIIIIIIIYESVSLNSPHIEKYFKRRRENHNISEVQKSFFPPKIVPFMR